MHNFKRFAVPLLVVALLAVGSLTMAQAAAEREERQQVARAAAASGGFTIGWDVAAGGGGQMASSSYMLHATAGQPAIGTMTGGSFGLHSGYWQGTVQGFWEWILYLPTILRGP